MPYSRKSRKKSRKFKRYTKNKKLSKKRIKQYGGSSTGNLEDIIIVDATYSSFVGIIGYDTTIKSYYSDIKGFFCPNEYNQGIEQDTILHYLTVYFFNIINDNSDDKESWDILYNAKSNGTFARENTDLINILGKETIRHLDFGINIITLLKSQIFAYAIPNPCFNIPMLNPNLEKKLNKKKKKKCAFLTDLKKKKKKKKKEEKKQKGRLELINQEELMKNPEPEIEKPGCGKICYKYLLLGGEIYTRIYFLLPGQPEYKNFVVAKNERYYDPIVNYYLTLKEKKRTEQQFSYKKEDVPYFVRNKKPNNTQLHLMNMFKRK